MLGDPSRAVVALGQQARCVPVRLGAVGRRDLRVDGRCAEIGWAKASGRSSSTPGPHEQLGGLPPRSAGVSPASRAACARLGALQNRHRPSEAGRVRAQPRELQQRPAAHA